MGLYNKSLKDQITVYVRQNQHEVKNVVIENGKQLSPVYDLPMFLFEIGTHHY